MDKNSVEELDPNELDDGEYTDSDLGNYSEHSGYSDMFEALELMEQIDQIEFEAHTKGLSFTDEGFHDILSKMNEFIDPDLFETTIHDDSGFYEPFDSCYLWHCADCGLFNLPDRLRCIACFSWSDLVRYTLTGNTMITLMSYLDGATLINLYLCEIDEKSDCNVISEMIHSRTRTATDPLSAIKEVDNIREMECVLDTDYGMTYEQWKDKVFAKWDIEVWGQPIEMKQECGWKRIGISFHRNYISFQSHRMEAVLRWIFSADNGTDQLERLDVYGIEVNQDDVKKIENGKHCGEYMEVMIIKNRYDSKRLVIKQSKPLSNCHK